VESVRIDKWLYAVRIYKTRALASEACRRGRVLVNGQAAKPSKELRMEDIVTVRKLPLVYNYQVKAIIDKRTSARLATEYFEDLTSPEELNKLKIKETFFIRRDKGKGRPTKKERRDIDRLNDNFE
jgi:ribosome-associated heat shock protein Hsp15